MKATLLVKSGLTDKQEYPLEEGKSYLIGRSREADVIVKDKLASRNHCKVAAAGAEEWTAADLGSSNGTYVNRQRITTQPLRNGDSIQIGKAVLEFRLLSATTAPTVVSGEPGHQPAPGPNQAIIRPVGLRPTTRNAPSPQAAAPPRAEPARAEASEKPQEPAKPKESVDEDIRGLFEFLDKVGKGGKPAEEDKVPSLRAKDAGPRRLDDETPAAGKENGSEAPLFSLLDDAADDKPLPPKQPPAPPHAPPPPPPQTPAGEQGGLLAFLRKKKQQT